MASFEFLKYQSSCPFCKFSLKDGYASTFEQTCRRRDNIPAGYSWGVCDEAHCPEFGEELVMKDVVAMDSDTGEVIFTADEAVCKVVSK